MVIGLLQPRPEDDLHRICIAFAWHLHEHVMFVSETEDRLTASAALSHAWLLIGGTSRPRNFRTQLQPEVAGAQVSSCFQGEGGTNLGQVYVSV